MTGFDPTQPSHVHNVHIIGQLLVGSGPNSRLTDSTIEPALMPRRPRWMPERVASWLRRMVTGPTSPLLDFDGP